ncbi:MAG TPA: hypothetical protein PKW60_04810 [Candidatus Hydrogenedentes bacterium]|jgi:phage shock protein B|nr:hypothetical protein [Candidatus Hydrogenedentota bacterium]
MHSFSLTLVALAVVLIPLLALAVLVLLVLGLVRIFTGQPIRTSPALEAQEAALMQELHRNMARLEERLENIETLVLEREGHKSDSLRK